MLRNSERCGCLGIIWTAICDSGCASPASGGWFGREQELCVGLAREEGGEDTMECAVGYDDDGQALEELDWRKNEGAGGCSGASHVWSGDGWTRLQDPKVR